MVSNIFFYVHLYLGKIPILTNIFQMGWNHQLVIFMTVKAWGIHLYMDPPRVVRSVVEDSDGSWTWPWTMMTKKACLRSWQCHACWVSWCMEEEDDDHDEDDDGDDDVDDDDDDDDDDDVDVDVVMMMMMTLTMMMVMMMAIVVMMMLKSVLEGWNWSSFFSWHRVIVAQLKRTWRNDERAKFQFCPNISIQVCASSIDLHSKTTQVFN